ncbi:MAG: proteasome subunit beta, partial [Nitrospirota bacterium]
MPFRIDQPDSSFYDMLNQGWPNLGKPISAEPVEGQGKTLPFLPHGTTVLAIRYRDGVVMAGDRMATEGYQVSARRIEKVYRADEFSAIAISGAAGPSIEMARLFQVELEHYEKLEGVKLSMEGKASKLAAMIKGNLPMAMQGLVVMPLFAGYDHRMG